MAEQTIGKEVGRKLSVKEMGFDKPTIQKLCIGDQETKHFLARFVGVVTGLKPYKTKAEGDRESEVKFGLMGQFEGTNIDGETREGSVLYLPGYVNDAIVSAFSADESISAINVAYDVYAQYDEDAATSYIFTVNDLLNTGNESVAAVKDVIKALPLPKATPALPAPGK